MKAILALLLVALLVVCAQSKRAFPGKTYGGLIRPRWVFNKKALVAAPADEEDDEESDFWMALAPLAINLIKNKLSKRDEADDEEADFINWKKIGEVAKNVGKSYLSSKYGINLDNEDEEEADAEFFKNLLKKVGGIALQAGKAYVGSKYGIQLDEEDEETDAEFLGKLKSWWSSKGQDLFQKGLQIYSAIKGNKAAPAAEAPAEGDAIESDSSDAYSQISAAGLSISSSGRCHNRNVRSCTSLDGIRGNTLNGIIAFKRASGCPVTITGGTEIGHAGGQFSHSNGYKVDIALNSCVDGYITRHFQNIGRRGDGSAQYKSSSGVFAREGNHWDITFQ